METLKYLETIVRLSNIFSKANLSSPFLLFLFDRMYIPIDLEVYCLSIFLLNVLFDLISSLTGEKSQHLLSSNDIANTVFSALYMSFH